MASWLTAGRVVLVYHSFLSSLVHLRVRTLIACRKLLATALSRSHWTPAPWTMGDDGCHDDDDDVDQHHLASFLVYLLIPIPTSIVSFFLFRISQTSSVILCHLHLLSITSSSTEYWLYAPRLTHARHIHTSCVATSGPCKSSALQLKPGFRPIGSTSEYHGISCVSQTTGLLSP